MERVCGVETWRQVFPRERERDFCQRAFPVTLTAGRIGRKIGHLTFLPVIVEGSDADCAGRCAAVVTF